jgi:hypothetical protein
VRLTWNRVLWGVTFSSPRTKQPMMLGQIWRNDSHVRIYYDGEPSRALLFKTRSTARAWCREQHQKYAGRDDVCAEWRFRPIRVREAVVPVRKRKQP